MDESRRSVTDRPARRARSATSAIARAFVAASACAPALALAADPGERSWLGWIVLGAVALFVAGVLIRAAIGSSTPPGWLAFLARRRDERRPTRWRDWPED
ncbi:hypothetical protein BURK1_00477 [Burkholderiales bacterium]|nr:hypothetical protein BURK1_00477 [Burkholderiales bacterium]